ncbi:MAG: substrate-binding domain-containing protein [Planctomycetota bacterium]|jgi:ABC-type sugar transport system substrate-binding protein|nr:substrate-binding domain-containing protein [Planctomycetota bacterium]
MKRCLLGILCACSVALTSSAADSAFYDSLPFSDIFPMPAGAVETKDGAKQIKLGFSQTGFNHPWRIEMNNSVQAEVDRHPNVTVVMTDGNVDVAKQHSDVEDLISQGCDAIIMSPIDSAALVNTAKRVAAAGIPLIILDRDVYAEKTVFIGQSNYVLGKQLGELLVKDFGGKANVVEITGLKGTAAAIERQQGFRDAIAGSPDIRIVAEGDGEFIREPAAKLMDDFLIAHENIDAVYTHAEESSWGADLAIRRAGRSGDGIKQYTIDASNGGFRSVQSGQFRADANYTPHIGQVGVRAALYVLTGKALDGLKSYEHGSMRELPELPVVTAENVNEWIGKGWGE